MEAIDELAQLSESMRQASALLADEDIDETTSSSSSSRRSSTFLNVVALGNVGAGKSAVLNSLIGHPVLPTGENGATRAPISIELSRDSSVSSKSIILQIDSKNQQVSASALRHSLQERLSKGSSGRSRDEIYLKLRTSTAPPLKLIDLPGVDQRIVDDSMISDYVQHNDAILLVVIPATQAPEISSSRALRIAKEYDAESTRTVGVISKIDQAATESKALAAVQALLLNQGPPKTSDIPWVALIGQSVSIASAQSASAPENSLETAWRAESESLKSILTGAPPSKLGRVALVDALAGQIRSRMKLRLPNLLSGIAENELLKQDWRSRKKAEIFQYVVLKWTLALLIGLGTGLVGFFNNLAIENIAGFKLLVTNNLMLKEMYYQAFATYAGCNVVLAIAAAALCAYVAPAAAGSGIPEVKAYLNGVDAPSILAPATLFVKIFGSIFGVAAGFVVGKEGPMVHTGACIASFLGQGGSRKYHLTWKWLRYFKNDRDRRDLITCGSAAGVAAAFRAPVGGVLFALEEAASWWRSALLWRTFFTTAVVAVVLRSLIEFCRTGKCGLFGQGGLIMFDVNSTKATYSTPDLLAVMFLGVIGGVFGSFYNYCVDKVLRTYSIINERGPSFKILLVIVISLLTSCCSYGLPWLSQCIPCPPHLAEQCPTESRSGNFKNFQCPPNHYNNLASLFFNTNDDAIRILFTSGSEKEFDLSTLLVFFVAIFCLGIVTYGIAVPSGLFIPVILAGASYGRLVGTLLGPLSNLDVGLFALLGAASFLGGTMRMTVSLCVILLELTNDLLMLPLMMLVLLISKSVADIFNKGVYDQIMKIKGLPYMETHAEPYMRHLIASDVVSGPLVSFSGVEKVGNILHVLRVTRHNGFPVIDEPPYSDAPELCGLVLRSHLLVLLKGKKFTKQRVKTGSDIVRGFKAHDFAKAGSGKGVKLEDLEITEEEMEMYIDLHPIANTSPYTVVESMSLAKAAVLFRELGLRHLCVVSKTPGMPPIVGILTRHDFTPEHVLGLYPHIKPHK